MNPSLERDVMAALSVLPEDMWDTMDDLCDCMYPRIGMWTNPYLAETLEVRMCCIWKELYQLFPGFMRVTPAFLDYNKNEWASEPIDWNGEEDMPKAVWYRHMARKEGIPVAEARAKYADLDYLRPRGIPQPKPEVIEGEPAFNPLDMVFEMVTGLAQEVAKLYEITDRLDAAGLASVQRGASTNRRPARTRTPRALPVGDGEVAS